MAVTKRAKSVVDQVVGTAKETIGRVTGKGHWYGALDRHEGEGDEQERPQEDGRQGQGERPEDRGPSEGHGREDEGQREVAGQAGHLTTRLQM